jgi:hypothetical protein
MDAGIAAMPPSRLAGACFRLGRTSCRPKAGSWLGGLFPANWHSRQGDGGQNRVFSEIHRRRLFRRRFVRRRLTRPLTNTHPTNTQRQRKNPLPPTPSELGDGKEVARP